MIARIGFSSFFVCCWLAMTAICLEAAVMVAHFGWIAYAILASATVVIGCTLLDVWEVEV